MIEEVSVQCPYCWETIVLEVDLSAGNQQYTEDCSVCCHPMFVHVSLDGAALSVEVEREGG